MYVQIVYDKEPLRVEIEISTKAKNNDKYGHTSRVTVEAPRASRKHAALESTKMFTSNACDGTCRKFIKASQAGANFYLLT